MLVVRGTSIKGVSDDESLLGSLSKIYAPCISQIIKKEITRIFKSHQRSSLKIIIVASKSLREIEIFTEILEN